MVWSIGFVEKANLGDLANYLRQRNLGYPNYAQWAEKTVEQVRCGSKHAISAYNNGIHLGHVIFQEHPVLPRVGEIKQLRVDKRAFGQGLGDFLIKQAEFELRNYVDTILCDTRIDQSQVIKLLKRLDYVKTREVNLYGDGIDLVFIKQFKKRKSHKTILSQKYL